MPSAFLIRRSGGSVEVLAPYSAEFVDALKAAVPYRYRDFDPGQKAWTVRPPYVDAAAQCAQRHFAAVEWLVPEHAARTPATTASLSILRQQFPDHAVLHVLPDAPVSVVHGAYRALALEQHPDRAGASAHQAMVALNLAFARLNGRASR